MTAEDAVKTIGKVEYEIVRCTEPGCKWTEAYKDSASATRAGEYHARRERHLTYNVAPLSAIAEVLMRSLDAVKKAEATKPAA